MNIAIISAITNTSRFHVFKIREVIHTILINEEKEGENKNIFFYCVKWLSDNKTCNKSKLFFF